MTEQEKKRKAAELEAKIKAALEKRVANQAGGGI